MCTVQLQGMAFSHPREDGCGQRTETAFVRRTEGVPHVSQRLPEVRQAAAAPAAAAVVIVVVRQGEPVAGRVLHALLLQPEQRLLLGRQALVVLCGV